MTSPHAGPDRKQPHPRKGSQAFAKFTPEQRWIATGQLLDVATPEEAQMMLGKFPLPVRGLWHLIGRRTYRRYIEHVRGGDHR